MIYCFDIDGTICSLEKDGKYLEAELYYDVALSINRLHEEGHIIKIMTARGSVSGRDWSEETKKQLDDWGIKYHELIMNKKPHADLFIDDKAININDYRSRIRNKRETSFVAGNFDVIHPGYIQMFKKAKEISKYLIVGLHSDPSIGNPSKIKPALSTKDRKEMLQSLRYVDEVFIYDTESQLLDYLKNNEISVRILGDDYKNKEDYTGKGLKIPIFYVDRSHGWSTTKFKTMIGESVR